KIEKLLSIKDEGYGRMFSNGQVLRVDNIIKDIAQYSNVEVYILIDRFIMPTDNSKFANDDITRMQDSVQTAFNEGNGHLKVAVVGAEQTYKDFSNIFEADGMRFEEPTELMFSYNNPIGACPVCGGYGSMVGIDEGLVIPNSSLSVYEGAIACWRGETMSNYLKEFIAVSNKFDFPIHRPYANLTKEQKKLLWNGNSYFTGINVFFEMVDSMKYKIQYKYMLARYSGKTTCKECDGSRLRKDTNYVKIGGKTITELMDMSISNLNVFFNKLKLED
ncbi:MAG: excinuclease ABC subunit A, partial [Bacteroidales bacterium]